MLSVNVTSLPNNYLDVLALSADVICLQETRVNASSKRNLTHNFASYGWTVHWGEDLPPVSHAQGSEQAAPGGVAICVRSDLKSVLCKATKRWCHAAVALSTGARMLHIFSVYGEVRDSHRRELTVQEVLGEAMSLGRVPAVIMGDLNCNDSSSPVIAQALRSGR